MDEIKQGWKDLFDSWRQPIKAQLLITQNLIQQTYDDAIECAEDNACCSVEQTVYENYLLQIDITENMIKDLQDQWDDLEEKRLAIEEECPDQDYAAVLAEYGRL